VADQISDLDESRDEPPEPPVVRPFEPSRPARPWWSRLLLGVLTLGIAGVTLVHLAMTFLVNSPSGTLTQKLSPQINAWIYPWFDQNWRLFAPNPLSENIRIEVRVSASCGQNATPWYDLTAMDDNAIRHNPFPGHTEQNELRRAWLDGYLPSHGANDEPLGNRAEMLRQYLVNIALERVRPLTAKSGLPPGSIADIEFRVTTQKVVDPATAGRPQPPPPEVRIVPWRQVSSDVISYGLCYGAMPA
jgi:hypothetical protein